MFYKLSLSTGLLFVSTPHLKLFKDEVLLKVYAHAIKPMKAVQEFVWLLCLKQLIKLRFMRELFFLIVFFSLSSALIGQNVAATHKMEPKVEQTTFKKDTFNINKYGAKSDGIFLNTTAINEAIADCNKQGGGVVLIPLGFWLTGPVVIQSNVNLHLQKNALLQFTNDFTQYPLVKSNWEGLPQMRNQSPLSANNAQNIAITGFGIIDGWGDAQPSAKGYSYFDFKQVICCCTKSAGFKNRLMVRCAGQSGC